MTHCDAVQVRQADFSPSRGWAQTLLRSARNSSAGRKASERFILPNLCLSQRDCAAYLRWRTGGRPALGHRKTLRPLPGSARRAEYHINAPEPATISANLRCTCASCLRKTLPDGANLNTPAGQYMPHIASGRFAAACASEITHYHSGREICFKRLCLLVPQQGDKQNSACVRHERGYRTRTIRASFSGYDNRGRYSGVAGCSARGLPVACENKIKWYHPVTGVIFFFREHW